MDILLICIIVLAVAFDFVNGFHDTANAIATTVYTHALSVGAAIALAASMNLLGAVVSENVAQTISEGLVAVTLDSYVILAALISAILWNLFTWWRSIPSSSSHALIGSLLGATILYSMTFEGVQWNNVFVKVILPLFTSPLLGFLCAFLAMKLILQVFKSFNRAKVHGVFKHLQLLSAALVAFAHGTNDAQKTMGIITLALISGNVLAVGEGVPLWVKLLCATAIACGTMLGGKRVMKTMGSKVTKLDSAGGFAAQTTSALVIQGMSALGAPISTTQVITTAVMGVGSAHSIKSVNWGIARDIALTWVITLPVTALLGAGVVFIIETLVRFV